MSLGHVDVFFTTNPGNLLSRLIRLSTWSKWSHCGIVNGDTTIEAKVGGVSNTPLPVALKHGGVIVRFPCPTPNDAIAFAYSQIGKPFDFGAILGIGLHREWQDNGSWFCSELVAASLAAGGASLFRKGFGRRVTPQHLWMLNNQKLHYAK